MGGKTAIALGLVSGLAAGALLLGTAIALVPAPAAPAIATPPAATVTPMPTTPAPTPSPAATPSTAPADSVGAAAGIGAPAPPLRLPLVGGGSVDLADNAGSPVWVAFMATWCTSCADELPSMAGFLARYEDTGLVILAVDVREDEATVQAFLDDLGTVVPTGLDTDGTAQATWGALTLPANYWVDADGIIRDAAPGTIGPDEMAQRLQTILPGVVVTP